MARPPAGPIGNSPRDVRDDAIGVPADDIKAPEPPRWPPKPKKVTKNDFHAKISGGASAKRADRKPHFRRGGFVKGFASGGSVESKMEKREEKPGEQKNDPFAKQNLRGGGNVKKKLADGGSFGGGVQQPGKLRSESTELAQARRGFDKNPKDTDAALKLIRTEDQSGSYLPRRSTGEGRYQKGGGVKKADGGGIGLRSEKTQYAKAMGKMTGWQPDPKASLGENWQQQKKNIDEVGRVSKETGYKGGGKIK